MPREAKSQWDFADKLFPAAETRKIFSVTELTAKVRAVVEGQVGNVWVTGEVTNLKAQSSGHVYFTLKDAGAQISCVLFRGELQVDRSLLADGRKVNLRGGLTVYEQRGVYQLRVQSVELQGIGSLQAAFERLKQKLNAAGMFAPERKRPLPMYARRIGLVTSPTGAAIRDVLHVFERRNKSLEIILVPCRVQGEGAAMDNAAAIQLLNHFHSQNSEPNGNGLDLILVTRGGGSLEDLWAFNEEAVAHAIFASALPIVSAIGHEIDFTISDFVADFRAATPSAAAERITEGVFSSCEFVAQAGQRLRDLTLRLLEEKTDSFAGISQRLARQHPRRRFDDFALRLDEAAASLGRCARQQIRQYQAATKSIVERLVRVRPGQVLKERRKLLHQEELRLREQMKHQLLRLQQSVASFEARLRLLGPEQVLARGYSITTHAATGQVLRSPNHAPPGAKLKTRLSKGEITSTVDP